MITLDASITQAYAWLSEPPTVAAIVGVDAIEPDPRAHGDPYNANAMGHVIATYAYGIFDDDGTFKENLHLPRFLMGVDPVPVEPPLAIVTEAFPRDQTFIAEELVANRDAIIRKEELAANVRAAVYASRPDLSRRSAMSAAPNTIALTAFDEFAIEQDVRLLGKVTT